MMIRKTLIAVSLTLGLGVGTAQAAGDAAHPHGPEEGWSFEGFFGSYDQAALQRGYQVYRQVCSACHSMDLLSYRNLAQPGGPEFPEEVVKKIAESDQVLAGPDEEGNIVDDSGLPLTRSALLSDRFKKPFANDQAAMAANGGSMPPDLSVINKARHYGADYVYDLLAHGYVDPPAEVAEQMMAGKSYNKYFPGGQISMAPPLMDEMLEYEDGTKATKEQMAKDVVHFLEWAGEPKMEARKNLGLQVMIYLSILAVLMYISYRRIWRDVDH